MVVDLLAQALYPEALGFRFVLITWPVSAVSRRENVAPQALAAAVSLWALDALRLVVPSAVNRRALAAAGLLPALARILKAALSRLHSLAAVLGAPQPLCPRPEALKGQRATACTLKAARSRLHSLAAVLGALRLLYPDC